MHSAERSPGTDDRAVLGVVSTNPGVLLGGGAFSLTGVERNWGYELDREFHEQESQLRKDVLVARDDLQRRASQTESFAAYALATLGFVPDESMIVDMEEPVYLIAAENRLAAEPTTDAKRNEDDSRELRSDGLASGSQPGPHAEGKPHSIKRGDWDLARQRFTEARLEYQGMVEAAMVDRFLETRLARVALAGRVPVNVESHSGPIRTGDYLAASSIAGSAMRASAPGPTIGIALEDFSAGHGEILMLVQRGWYGGAYA